MSVQPSSPSAIELNSQIAIFGRSAGWPNSCSVGPPLGRLAIRLNWQMTVWLFSRVAEWLNGGTVVRLFSRSAA